MNFADPFYGYSFVLRAIVYVVVPAFLILQLFRLRRALHVFQLEGYKRRRFLEWSRRNAQRALFLSSEEAKKPLAMTGRAWRILVVALLLNVVGVLVLPGIAHLNLGGFPADIATWAVTTVALFFGAPYEIVLADVFLTPVQRAINARYLRAARRKLERVDPLVVGVTGSFGKTSTKFAIETILGEHALATPGSYNTTLGVSRTVNENLNDSHRYFVVEMGAYRVGDIAEICRMVRPRIGVLTAIGPAHLERFGSLDNIRAAKYEIVATLPRDGIAVMNVDDREVRALADETRHVEVLRYGLDPRARPDVTAHDVRITTGGSCLTIVDTRLGEELTTSVRLLGRHSIGHVLAAVGVAKAAGRRLEELADAIERLAPVEHRLQLIEGTGGVRVIDDAYNSNPEGAAAALEVLEQMPGERKVVVTPGIVELGELQHAANESFGERAGRVADAVIVVGRVNREALGGGARRGGQADVIEVDSLRDAQAVLGRLLRPGDVVLFENDLPDQYE